MLAQVEHLVPQAAHTKQSKTGVRLMRTNHLPITGPERTKAVLVNLQPVKAVVLEGSRTRFLGQKHPHKKQMRKKPERKKEMEPQDLQKPKTKTHPTPHSQILVAVMGYAINHKIEHTKNVLIGLLHK